MAEVELEPTTAAERVSPIANLDPSTVPTAAAAADGVVGEAPAGEIGEHADVECGDHKRKQEAPKENGSDGAADAANNGGIDGVKRQKIDEGERAVDGSAINGGALPISEKEQVTANGQDSTEQSTHHTTEKENDDAIAVASEQGGAPSALQIRDGATSRKIEVPNNKVGVLIGKSGDTIKFLQINSGARIQITRDAEADPNSATRPVELIGIIDHINKAERLIKDVIAEADAGGSTSLVARRFSTTQSGAEQLEIQVPNEKVGKIIGKGGETIKTLQINSGARIQLITQNFLGGDASKEKTIRISGTKMQIETAREMIQEVMSQAPLGPSPLSGSYHQQNFHPRGPTVPQQGQRASHIQPTSGYDYQQKGTYPPQNTHLSQPHGGYPQQPPPRSDYSGVPQQRSGVPQQTGGYGYYAQGGPTMGTQPFNLQYPISGPSSNIPAVNYNYGQSQPTSYEQYGQSAPSQQSYGHESQTLNQQYYGWQPASSQPGMYEQPAPQGGYPQQQPYSSGYGGATSQGASQPYPQQGPTHPGGQMYQGPVPSAYSSSYGSSGPPHQSYPYNSNAQMPPAPSSYGQSYTPNPEQADGYTQSAQHVGQAAPAYGQQGGQPAQTGTQYGGYNQYPPQQGYGAPPVANNASYGYQGTPVPDAYGNTPSGSGYANTAPVSGQAGYVQPGSAPVGHS